MSDRWYQKAVVYCLDIDTFADSDGDGVGDIQGLIGRLDYLARLGVTCLWLQPDPPVAEPRRRLRRDGLLQRRPAASGTLGDFAELLHQAQNRGIRVIIDLVVNHTSDQHPWFQSARSSPDSPYRDWYVWSDDRAGGPHAGHGLPRRAGRDLDLRPDREGVVLPPVLQVPAGPQHRQPEGPRRRSRRSARSGCSSASPGSGWTRCRSSSSRPSRATRTRPRTSTSSPTCASTCSGGRATRCCWPRPTSNRSSCRPSSATRGGSGNRIHMLFDFMLNGRLMLALARGNPEPIIDALRDTPALPAGGQWATFLRNHDEVDLSRLTAEPARRGASPSSARTRTCSSTAGASAAGSPRCSAATAGASSSPTRCSSACAAPRCCGTARRSGWARTCRWTGATRSVPRCSGRCCPTPGSPPPSPTQLVRPVISGGEFGYQTGQRHRPAARPDVAAVLVRADDPHAA